jgi:hypothetical protein
MAPGDPTGTRALPIFPADHLPQSHQSPLVSRLPLSFRALELFPGTNSRIYIHTRICMRVFDKGMLNLLCFNIFLFFFAFVGFGIWGLAQGEIGKVQEEFGFGSA